MANRHNEKDVYVVHCQEEAKLNKRYHYTPIRMAKIQKTDNTRCEDVKQLEISYTTRRHEMIATLEDSLQFLRKLNILSLYELITVLLSFKHKGVENMSIHTGAHQCLE